MGKIIRRPFEFIFKNWIILLFILGYLLLAHFLLGEICIFKIIFGIPCPSCGITRAYINFLKFDFKDAFYYHPLFLLVPPVAIVLLYNDFKYIKPIYDSKVFWAILLITVVGLYIIRWIVLYPKAPMDINHNSLLFKIIDFFRDKVFK